MEFKYFNNYLNAELTFVRITEGGLAEFDYFDERKGIMRKSYEILTKELIAKLDITPSLREEYIKIMEEQQESFRKISNQ